MREFMIFWVSGTLITYVILQIMLQTTNQVNTEKTELLKRKDVAVSIIVFIIWPIFLVIMLFALFVGIITKKN